MTRSTAQSKKRPETGSTDNTATIIKHISDTTSQITRTPTKTNYVRCYTSNIEWIVGQCVS